MTADCKEYPAAATWVVAIHASADDDSPLGCGVVIDGRRVLTCRHVIEGCAPGEVWVAFPYAETSGADTRLRVDSIIPPAVPEPTKVKDLALLNLRGPVPAEVTPAPLLFPRPSDLTAKRWWAAGFPDGDPFGSTTAGTIESALGYGAILLAADRSADQWAPVAHGFSGGGLWSPDYQAVVAVVSQANGEGNGRAITLYQAAEWFPGESLKSPVADVPSLPQAAPSEPPEPGDFREPVAPTEPTGPNYALMIWQKSRNVQQDTDGRLYGKTGQSEDVQLDADRMWWPIARWRLKGLKALIFITDGKVNRIREVCGVDEETTGDSSSLALNVSSPLTADEVAERLPALRDKLDAENHEAVQGRLRKYLEF
jgi:hypothetical protein